MGLAVLFVCLLEALGWCPPRVDPLRDLITSMGSLWGLRETHSQPAGFAWVESVGTGSGSPLLT